VAPAYLHRVRERSLLVDATSLDVFLSRQPMRIHCLKIDAESAELEILRGAVHTLDAQRPIVIVEVGDLGMPAAPRSAQVIEFLCARGYQAWEWHAGMLHPHTLREHYAAGNLIFVHPESNNDC